MAQLGVLLHTALPVLSVELDHFHLVNHLPSSVHASHIDIDTVRVGLCNVERCTPAVLAEVVLGLVRVERVHCVYILIRAGQIGKAILGHNEMHIALLVADAAVAVDKLDRVQEVRREGHLESDTTAVTGASFNDSVVVTGPFFLNFLSFRME